MFVRTTGPVGEDVVGGVAKKERYRIVDLSGAGSEPTATSVGSAEIGQRKR